MVNLLTILKITIKRMIDPIDDTTIIVINASLLIVSEAEAVVFLAGK